jgi:hypothetical protein
MKTNLCVHQFTINNQLPTIHYHLLVRTFRCTVNVEEAGNRVPGEEMCFLEIMTIKVYIDLLGKFMLHVTNIGV